MARDSGGRADGGHDLSQPHTFTITVDPIPDSLPPTPRLSTDQPPITNQQVIDLRVDFGELVNGFTVDDVAISGGTARPPIDRGLGRYTVTIDGRRGAAAGPNAGRRRDRSRRK